MKAMITLIFLSFLFSSCSEPTGKVFEDNRLAEEETLKFCLVGNVGENTAYKQALVESMGREECQRIILLGNLVSPSGIESPDDPLIEERLTSYFSPLLEANPKLGLLLTMGPHDHLGNTEAYKEFSEDNESYFFPDPYYLVDYGGLCLVALDSQEVMSESPWMLELQSKLKTCDIEVAVSHNGYEGASVEFKSLLDTFVVGKFPMMISADDPRLLDTGREEMTRMIEAGGEGYVVLTWQKSNPKRLGMRLQTVDTVGNVFDESEIQAMEEAPLTLWGKIRGFISKYLP